MAKMIEYGATWIMAHKGSDIDAKNVDDVRRIIIKYWTDDGELVCVWRAAEGRPLTGYLGFSPRYDSHYWITADGKCRTVYPGSGKLGKPLAIPRGVMARIRQYEGGIRKSGYGTMTHPSIIRFRK